MEVQTIDEYVLANSMVTEEIYRYIFVMLINV